MNASKPPANEFEKREFKKLCYIIGFKAKEIREVLASVDDCYRVWTKPKKDKETGQLKTYLDGRVKTRTFRVPSTLLKVVQRRIKDNILVPIKLPNSVHGGVKRRSNITNAKAHQGNKYFFATDLQDFYPNISSERVYETFLNLKFSRHFSRWLTSLTTFDNQVPQGAPTSSHISNIVFLETELKLIRLCNQNGITYTRFVDDLIFSSQHNFGPLIGEILGIISSSGFNLSRRKTKYVMAKQIEKGNKTLPSVTGIIVLPNRIDAPYKIIERSKVEMESNSVAKPYTNYLKSIRKTNAKKGKPTVKKKTSI